MDLIGAEIFDVGKWNGLEFSDDDLNEIVSAFESLRERHHVPLKLGHNDDQPITDGQPAIGWVNRIYRKGSKLVADFTNLPTAIYDAITKRLYRSVSIELLFDVKHQDRKFPMVLDAVALLGADQPAVNTLEDLATLTLSRLHWEGERVTYSSIKGKVQSKGGNSVDSATEKRLEALQKQLDDQAAANRELKGKLSDAQSEVATFKKAEDDRVKAEEKAAITKARAEVGATFDAAIKASAITPAQREHFERLFGVNDDQRVVGIDLDELKAALNFKEGDDVKKDQSFSRKTDDDKDETSAEDFLTAKAKERAFDKGISFSRALADVGEIYPERLREWVDQNGVKPTMAGG